MIALLVSFTTLLTPIQDAETRPTSTPAPQVQRVKAKRRDSSKSLMSSLARAVDWLAAQQEEDGRWRSLDVEKRGKGNQALDVGVTGLALLALLSEGHTLEHGKHKAKVAKGVAWLLEQQDKKSGLLGPASSNYSAYNHALATWALVELQSDTMDKATKDKTVQALLHTKQRRNPYQVWRYYPRDGDNDSSITGWMMLGLIGADRQGLVKIKSSKHMALAWYQQVTDPKTGRVGYTKRGQGSSRDERNKASFPASETEALTALSLLIQLRCGKSPQKQPVLKLAIDRILALPPEWNMDDGNIDLYYWFFASLALAEAKVPEAIKWNRFLITALQNSQVREGKTQGSWDPIDAWANTGGRTYMSALAILSLSAATGKSRLLTR